MSKYEIRHDGNHRGLIATERISQGETVLTPQPIVLEARNKYSLEMYPGIHFDCDDSPVGAINHCCNPNAAVRGSRIVAWACIEPGDEITLDYRRTEEHLSEPFKCRCGSCDGTWMEW